MSLRSEAGATMAANARGAWTERRGCLLTLEDQTGVCGMGEASPLPGYSSDTLAQARLALENWWREVPGLETDGDTASWIQRQVARIPSTVPSARFAVETALLDLWGRLQGVPSYQLLANHRDRSDATAISPAAEVALSGLIMSLEVSAALAQAADCRRRGLESVKVKIGRPGQWADELKLLATLRQSFGDDLALRLDANGALPAATVRDSLQQLASVAPEFLEEPVSGQQLLDLSDSPVPLAVDETLRDADALQGLMPWLEATEGAVMVLKPMVLGGAYRCLQWASEAARRGVGVVISHLFDGPVALAASCSLALALPQPPYACGLDRHTGLDAWPAWPVSRLTAGRIVRDGRPGLGIEIS